jgi:hypothetical protein
MNKLINESTVTVLTYPTASTGLSASANFVDVSRHRNFKFEAVVHRLPDGKGEGVVTATVYEHTVSAWTGVATAVTAGVVTASVTSVSDALLQKELKVDELSINANKKFVNAYVTLPTSTSIACTVTRWAPRFEPQD